MSARQLQWLDQEGHSGFVQLYVLELPISLWGRDLLKGMGFKLANEYSATANGMMQAMGYLPGWGIGKHLQGRTSPVLVQQRQRTQGLGFS